MNNTQATLVKQGGFFIRVPCASGLTIQRQKNAGIFPPNLMMALRARGLWPFI